MLSIQRINLNLELHKQFKRLKKGKVLDIGSGNPKYKKHTPHTEYITLDIDKKTKPDICCDAHRIKHQANYFDTIISTETLEHLHNPQKAVDEIHRVLKPKGTCILSTVFFYPYHPCPEDHYRFTENSLSYLFRKFSKVEIVPYGNRVHMLWQILLNMLGERISLILKQFNPLIAKIRFKDKRFPCGFVVYAEKHHQSLYERKKRKLKEDFWDRLLRW